MQLPSKKMLTRNILALTAGCLLAGNAMAQTTRVTVQIENVAPDSATFQTPVWIGLHDGVEFDTYNGNTPAGSRPINGSVNALGQSAMEAICEDGTTAQIAADFATLQPFGLDTTVPGPNGPIAPGETVEFTFEVDPLDPSTRFFSYATMVIPSNDFCLSNGSPVRHPVFSESGEFIAADFFVTGLEALDAGTEVNDELPANTAFFGQAAPNTGVDENGVIGTIGSDLPATTFIAPNAADPAITILEDPRFSAGDFSVTGYPFLKFSFSTEAAPAIVDDLDFRTVLRGRNEVPSIRTRTVGTADAQLREGGTAFDVQATIIRLPEGVDVTAAHLHLGAEGENGPVIANLLTTGTLENTGQRRRINAGLSASDLVGPFAGQSLSTLVEAIQEGRVYVNIHSTQNPAGEVRGQLAQQ